MANALTRPNVNRYPLVVLADRLQRLLDSVGTVGNELVDHIKGLVCLRLILCLEVSGEGQVCCVTRIERSSRCEVTSRTSCNRDERVTSLDRFQWYWLGRLFECVE